jgi:hypothetical protein
VAEAESPVTLDDVLRLAIRLSPVDRVRLIERMAPDIERELVGHSGTPTRSLLGPLKESGPAPSKEEIDAARHEAWRSFPRDNI